MREVMSSDNRVVIVFVASNKSSISCQGYKNSFDWLNQGNSILEYPLIELPIMSYQQENIQLQWKDGRFD